MRFGTTVNSNPTHLSGSVMTSSTTVPGGGLPILPVEREKTLVLIFLETMMKANSGFVSYRSKHFYGSKREALPHRPVCYL